MMTILTKVVLPIYKGARSCGMHAVLLDRAGQVSVEGVLATIPSLEHLPAILDALVAE